MGFKKLQAKLKNSSNIGSYLKFYKEKRTCKAMQMENNKINKEQIENLYSIMSEIIDEDVICTKLLEGWILINYAHGWLLEAPYVPYKNQETLKVSNEVVMGMFYRGLLNLINNPKKSIIRGYLT